MAYEHTKTLVESRADIVTTSETGYSLLKHIYQFDSLRIHACGSETGNLQLNEKDQVRQNRGLALRFYATYLELNFPLRHGKIRNYWRGEFAGLKFARSSNLHSTRRGFFFARASKFAEHKGLVS